jgi:hypothetical protein
VFVFDAYNYFEKTFVPQNQHSCAVKRESFDWPFWTFFLSNFRIENYKFYSPYKLYSIIQYPKCIFSSHSSLAKENKNCAVALSTFSNENIHRIIPKYVTLLLFFQFGWIWIPPFWLVQSGKDVGICQNWSFSLADSMLSKLGKWEQKCYILYISDIINTKHYCLNWKINSSPAGKNYSFLMSHPFGCSIKAP